MSQQRLPRLLLALGFAAVLGGAYYFFGAATPLPDPSVSPPIVKSTLQPFSPAAPRALPLAASSSLATRPAANAYNTETYPSSGIPTTQPPTSRVLDPAQPGNQLHFQGKLISIAETIPSPQGNDLAADILPAPAAAHGSAPTASGLSAEEELFRAKWGWAATDQVKKAAVVEDDSTGR